jgi:hypothetical protein
MLPSGVGTGAQPFTVPREGKGLKAERGEGREDAKDAGQKKLVSGGANENTPTGFSEGGEKADREGAKDVNQHRTPRNRLSEGMRDKAGGREPRHPTETAVECYPEV